MKISEYIGKLQEIMNEHGDLLVQTSNAQYDRVDARAPTVDHEAILYGRETKRRFASEFKYYNPGNKERTGKMVCRL